MPAALIRSSPLDDLNEAQRLAVEHDLAPLLVIAGAGSGKTNTLAHRVAHLILGGANPQRILLLTFSRRAAIEMTRRASRIVGAWNARAMRNMKATPNNGVTDVGLLSAYSTNNPDVTTSALTP